MGFAHLSPFTELWKFHTFTDEAFHASKSSRTSSVWKEGAHKISRCYTFSVWALYTKCVCILFGFCQCSLWPGCLQNGYITYIILYYIILNWTGHVGHKWLAMKDQLVLAHAWLLRAVHIFFERIQVEPLRGQVPKLYPLLSHVLEHQVMSKSQLSD